MYNENIIKMSILQTAHRPYDFYTSRIDINGWIVQKVVTLFLKARTIDWGRRKKYAPRNAYDFIILFYRHVSPVVFHRVTNGCTDIAIPQRCNWWH